MKVVKFIRPSSKYSPGDIAGFEGDYADALIKVGAAEAYDPEDPAGADASAEEVEKPSEAVEQAPASEKPARAGRSK